MVNNMISSLKGYKKNPDVKLLLGENCMILKIFSEWKAPVNSPL
jgi:hypothetical protein